LKVSILNYVEGIHSTDYCIRSQSH
jgi:hypothetical protein